MVEHGADVEAEAVVGADGERLEVGVGEEVVEVDGARGRRVLEERVVVVPRAQLVDGAAEARRRARSSSVALPLGERRRGGAVDVVEGGEQPVLVELAGGEREREVVAVRRARCAASLRSRASSRIRSATSATDLLRRLPRARRRRRVVARAQDLGDRVVVDALAVDLAAEVVERRLDRASRARRSRGGGRPAPGGARSASCSTSSWRRSSGSSASTTASRASRTAAKRERVGEELAARRARRRCGARRPRARSGCSTPTTPRPARARAGAAGPRGRRRARRGRGRVTGGILRRCRGVGRGRDHGPGVAGERLVDHLALERDGGVAAAPPLPSYAATRRRARSISSGDGVNARWASATCAGWMQSLPR